MKLLPNTKYVLISDTEKVEEYEHNELNNKDLLNLNDSENIIAFNRFIEDRTNILNNHAQVRNKPLGTLFKLAGVMPIYLYSDEDYITKYPNGLLTEGLIMIPAKNYNNVYDMHNETNVTAILFINALVQVIENKYNISFNENDFEKICNDSLKFMSISKEDDFKEMIQNIRNLPKLEAIKHSELILPLKENEYIKTLESTKSDGDYIDALLFNCSEINDNSHPFSQLKDKIKNITFDNSRSELNEKNFQNYNNADANTKVFGALKNILQDIGKKSIKDEQEFIDDLGKEWIPAIFKLAFPDYFKLALNDLYEVMSKYCPDIEKSFTFKKKLVTTLSLNNNFHQELKDITTTFLTEFYPMIRKKGYVFLAQEEYEIKKDYSQACIDGNLKKIKQILKDNDLDITFEDNKGLKLAMSNNQIDVVDYFLYSKELKNNLSIEEKPLLIQAILRHSDEFVDYLMNKNLLKDNDLLVDYEEKLKRSCERGHFSITKKLLEAPGAEKKFDEKLASLKQLCFTTRDNVELVKLLINNIDREINKTSNSLTKHNTKISKLQECFNGAVQTKNFEICRYFIFEYDLKISEGYRLYLQKEDDEKYKTVEKFLVLRDVNEKLTLELSSENAHKGKKSKL